MNNMYSPILNLARDELILQSYSGLFYSHVRIIITLISDL